MPCICSSVQTLWSKSGNRLSFAVRDSQQCLGMQVRDFQAIIGRETKEQCRAAWGGLPDVLLACVGGGSNAIGLFHDFVVSVCAQVHGGRLCGAPLADHKSFERLSSTLGEVTSGGQFVASTCICMLGWLIFITIGRLASTLAEVTGAQSSRAVNRNMHPDRERCLLSMVTIQAGLLPACIGS